MSKTSVIGLPKLRLQHYDVARTFQNNKLSHFNVLVIET